MRLGYHYHVPALRRPDGRVVTASSQGRFLDSLAEQCDELVCFLHHPRPEEEADLDYEVRSSKLCWVSIGPHASVPYRTFFPQRFLGSLARQRGRLDALLIRGPSPLLPAAARCVAGSIPLALLLVGDYSSIVDDLPQPWWRKEAIRCWALSNLDEQLAVARQALTIVNSEELQQRLERRLAHVICTRTTNLSETDFHIRKGYRASRPYRLLYAGRMDRGKGLLVLVEAVARLVGLGDDIYLDLVGPVQRGDAILHDVAQAATRHGVANRITYHGSRPIGPELFAFHRRAEVFINASLESEGFPRAIWEAQANSLPVVATRVGAIPFVLRDGESACLVAPRCAAQLGDGIGRAIHDTALRKRLISNGLAMATDNTLEKRTRELLGHLENWVRDPRSQVQ